MRWVLALGLAVWAGSVAAQAQCRPVFDTPPAPINSCADDARVTLALVGDVLLHSPLQRRGYRDGFDAVWGSVDPLLQAADIAIANLEGPVAAGYTRRWSRAADPGAVFDNVVHTSYPLFNYHASVLDALIASGVDVVTTANNHALDRGAGGADATIEALRLRGLAFVGTEPSDGARHFFHERDTEVGRLVLIACSFSANGVPDNAGQMLWCYRDRDTLLAMVRRHSQRPEVAAVIVLPHWGYEYTATPNANQRALAAELVTAGAALVVGAHPHVVQVWDQQLGPAGQVPIVFSTGNFVSGQPQFPRQVGMLAWIEMCRAVPGADLATALQARAVVATAGWVPVRMQRTGAGPQLFTVGENGAEGVVEQARQHIEGLIPGADMGARLICDAAPDFDRDVADLAVVLQ